MNLKRFLGDIDDEKGSGLHRVYEYTDANVFTKMRALHDDMDGQIKDMKKNKGSNLSKVWREREYINDCIKIIMDGKVPDPAVTAQRLVTLPGLRGKEELKRIRREAAKVAETVAGRLELNSRRIKANVVSQGVMKYTATEAMEEGANREAVRIVHKDVEGEEQVKYAPKSNASILKDLVEKELLILNVYWIGDKVSVSPADDERRTEMDGKIKDGFKAFISKYFQKGAPRCGCMEGGHMCQATENVAAAPPEEIDQYECARCGRIAAGESELCIGLEKDVDGSGDGQ